RDCFPGVDVAGGVCYFLWDRDHPAPLCEVTNVQGTYRKTLRRSLTETTPFVRANEALSIIHKVRALHEANLSEWVSSQKPFGLRTFVVPVQGPGDITLRWRGGVGPFLSALVTANAAWIPKWKVLISCLTADHAGQVDKDGKRRILAIVDLLPPGQVCTETYLVAGVFETEQEARNCIAYLKTQFVRFLIAQLATTQHISKASFLFVPQQDFSVAWTDAALNEKYGLTADEAAFIERLVKPMEA
ncbi:MAG: DEAD/DEAH box helicase, partial [Candidatus Spyradenecus sp.]